MGYDARVRHRVRVRATGRGVRTGSGHQEQGAFQLGDARGTL